MAIIPCRVCDTKLDVPDGTVDFICPVCGERQSVVPEPATPPVQQPAPPAPVSLSYPEVPQAEPMLRRAYLALEDEVWEEAQQVLNEVLNIAPECAMAYLGLAMAQYKCSTQGAFYALQNEELSQNRYVRRARQFASPELRERLDSLDRTAAKTAQETAKRKAMIRRAMKLIAASSYCVAAARSNGTVVWEYCGKEPVKFDTSRWSGVTAVACSSFHLVGLRSDGTVLATGQKKDACAVSSWRGIVAIAAGTAFTLGLRTDGTVAVAGENKYAHLDTVKAWTEIKAIAASGDFSFGLREDGTVVTTGDPKLTSQLVNVENIDMDAYAIHPNGTAEAISKDPSSELSTAVRKWDKVAAVVGGSTVTVGIRTDGSVHLFTRSSSVNVSDWTDIVAASAGFQFVVGLRANGTLAITGHTGSGGYSPPEWLQLNELKSWKLFESFETLEEEQERALQETAKKERKEKAEAARREKEKLQAEETHFLACCAKRDELTAEMASLGLFSGKRKKELQEQIEQMNRKIEAYLSAHPQ